MNNRYRFLCLFCSILLLCGLLPVPAAQAAMYREIAARYPASLVFPQPVQVWMKSDTSAGESAGLAYLDDNNHWTYRELAAFENPTLAGAKGYAEIPPFPAGSDIALQLNTYGANWMDYGFTGVMDFYTVKDLPDIVYVDDDWLGTPPGTDPDGPGPATNFGGDAFATIQAGIDGVAAEGTVNLAAGNYQASDLWIEKSLSLVGAGTSQTIIGPAVADGHQCNPFTSAHQGIVVAANDVSLSGFTLDGNADGSLAGDHHYRTGITTRYDLDTYNNLTVQNVAIQHAWYRGLVVRAKGGQTSSGHLVNNVSITDLAGCTGTGDSRGQAFGILLFDAAGEVSNSSVTGAGSGIAVSNYTATPLLANIHHNSVVAVDVQAYTLTFNAAGTVFERNLATYTDPTNNAIALLVDQPQGFTIRNNLLTGARIGVFVGRQSGPQEQFVIGEGNRLVGPGAEVLSSFGVLADGSSFVWNVNSNFIIEKTLVTQFGKGIVLDRQDDTGFNNVTVRSNQLVNNDIGLFAGVGSNIDLHHNRLVGNSFAGVQSIQNLAVENNWWGCNEGPGAAGCDGLLGPLDANPWLVLSASAGETSLPPEGWTLVQSSLAFNSASQDTSAAGAVPDGIQAAYSAPDGGSVAPLDGVSLGGSFSVFEFSAPVWDQAYRACVDVDHALVCANVSVENVHPQAAADAYNGAEDTLLSVAAPGVLANDSDINQDVLTAHLVEDAAHGDVTLAADGSFTYQAQADWFGVDSFTYKASDGSLESQTVTVELTLAPVNDAPVAQSQSVSLAEDQPTSITLGASDVDGDALEWLVEDPQHGSLSGTAPDLIYTPFLNYFGADSFTFKVNDGTLDSNQGVVNLTITPVNDPPVTNPDAYTIGMNGLLTVLQPGVLANDMDPEGNLMRAMLVESTEHGTLTLNPSGSFVYAPSAGWSGVDGFTYSVTDGLLSSATQTVTLTVTATNVPPVAAVDEFSVVEEGVLVVPAPGLLANDTDADGNPLLAVIRAQPAHGMVSIGLNGSFTYTPQGNFSGQDTFYYAAYDGLAYSADQAVIVTVTPVNDPPQAQADAYSLEEDAILEVAAVDGLLANDSDVDGDTLSIILRTSTTSGELLVNPDGSFRYTPQADFFGTDQFTYQVTDGVLLSQVVNVELTITPLNDPPLADDLVLLCWVNQACSGLLTGSDVDSTALTFALADGPLHGSLELDPQGRLIYTPETDFTGEDQFTFTLSDSAGGADTGLVQIGVYWLHQVWLPLILQ